MLSRLFQGLYWQLQVESEAGPLILVRQNDGTPVPEEGETVQLAFTAVDCTLLAPGEAP